MTVSIDPCKHIINIVSLLTRPAHSSLYRYNFFPSHIPQLHHIVHITFFYFHTPRSVHIVHILYILSTLSLSPTHCTYHCSTLLTLIPHCTYHISANVLRRHPNLYASPPLHITHTDDIVNITFLSTHTSPPLQHCIHYIYPLRHSQSEHNTSTLVLALIGKGCIRSLHSCNYIESAIIKQCSL